MDFKLFTAYDPPRNAEVDQLTNFLFHHLDQYGDAKTDIRRAIAYALKEKPSPGGFVLAGYVDKDIAGIVVVNRTGMEGYIPENILVYIAVDRSLRGQGIGKKLMLKAIEVADGDIALHVEPDNPARILYEKLGFDQKYLEMRFRKGKNKAFPANASSVKDAQP